METLQEINKKNLDLVEDLRINKLVSDELSRNVEEKNFQIEKLKEDVSILHNTIKNIGTFIFGDTDWNMSHNNGELFTAVKQSILDNVNYLGQVQALNSIISGMIVALKVGDNSRLQEKKVL